MAPHTLLALMAGTTLLGLQAASPFGAYVGRWPSDLETTDNLQAWRQLTYGVRRALVTRPDREDTRSVSLIEPRFLDGMHVCGVYQFGGTGNFDVSYGSFVARLETTDLGDPDDPRALPVDLITHEATAEDLDQYCPNLPDDVRAGILDPYARFRADLPHFDPDGIGMLDGRQRFMMHRSVQRVMPERPEGTVHTHVGRPGFREGDHYCIAYQRSTPQARAWTPHWMTIRIDAFAPRSDRELVLPVTIINADASPQDVAAWCPSLAASGDFAQLMTPEHAWAPAQHIASVEDTLTPAVIDHVNASLPADPADGGPPITASLGSPLTLLPQSPRQVCGTLNVHLASDDTTLHPMAFSARIAADRVPAGSQDPFPSWDVEVVDVALLSGMEAGREACPAFDQPRPEGYGIQANEFDQAQSLEAAIEAHRNGELVCHFWENDFAPLPGVDWPADAPGYPRDIGPLCRFTDYETARDQYERMNAMMRTRLAACDGDRMCAYYTPDN
jgi:hypothetical protein